MAKVSPRMKKMGVTGEDLANARRRRNLIIWIAVPIVLVVGIAGYFAYNPWRVKRVHREAREALNRGDYSEAALNARRALQMNPNFAPACLTMAEIAEHEQLAEAVMWREQVVRTSGESADTLLAYACTAIRFGKNSSALSALTRVPEKDRMREDYLVVAGTLALESGDNAEAARLYENASRINPENAAYRLALGKAQCSSDDYFTREQGRRTLAELGSHPKFGVSALRELINNCEVHKEYLSALRYANQLASMPTHEFPDDVLQLGLMRVTKDEKFSATLAAIQEKAESNPIHAGALLLWMGQAGLALDGLEWVQKRAPNLAKSPDLRPAIADCHLTLGHWNDLLAATETGAWKTAEHMRHAYRTRSFRELSDTASARTEWNLAVNAAARKTDALEWLVQMASERKWVEEAEQCLWALLDLSPGSRSAIASLQNHYLAKKNTAGLRRVSVHLVKTDPANENAQNDLALSSLLLNTESDQAMRIARDLHTRHPENAAYASTFAFALHCTARTTEGLKILEALPAEHLTDPSISAYYGILLAATNLPEKAEHFLEISREATLLPEEDELVAKAKQSIADALK